MESLARPPHRRKHSAITNSFSFKNPYDDVLQQNGGGGGKRKSFEANEYAEIFSGSSSIPVIDISGLDERAGLGPGELRSSKVDYSNIFGGLRNDDVAVPYEELFARKSKPRIPAEAPPRPHESVSQHSSGNKRSSSGEVPDQFADGVKQHFNMSFNRTTQRNIDEPNGKTHIAELHAVPGFAYFVDGNSRRQKREMGPPPPLKRGVSRTWSFSAEFEAPKGKGGLSHDESHIPEKLPKVDEVNLNANFSKFSPSSRCSSNLNGMDNEQSRVNNFATKQDDASRKIPGECSPPSLDEEFDENSVAAVSAAALKKAIDQAQESIRIAKMIMERKKEGLFDGLEPKLRGRVKIIEKEKKCDEFGAIFTLFTGIDGKLAPSLGRNDPVIKTENAELKMVGKNVEATKEHVLFSSDCNRREKIGMDEEVQKEKVRENVEEAEMCRETTDFPGLAANTECRTANLESGSKECENDRKREETFEEHEKMHDVERNSLNESSNLVGGDMMEQEKMKEAEHVSEWKENVHTHGETCNEEPACFPEMREVEKKVNEIYEPETDKNEQNHADDGNVPLLSEELEKNQVEEQLIITSEFEATDTIMMEANDGAQVQKDAAFWDAEVANNCFIDSNNSEGPTTPTILIEDTQEAGDANVNQKAEELNHDDGSKAEEVNHDDSSIPESDDNEMPEIDRLRRSASEVTFLESSKLQNAFENISFIDKTENINIDMMDANSLSEDDVSAFRTSTEILDADNTIPEFDLSDVGRVLEQTSESDEASVSAQDSEECPENANEETKNKLEMVPNEGQNAGEQSVPEEMEKSLENGKKTEEREDHQQRIEAIKKGREREKDRKAVERAIREARERAFAEARERAERAAVERAAAEVRQRAMAEAREKATMGKQTADKASIEAKLRAERAAVERATAEARSRALQKARSQKTDRNEHAERSSSSSRSHGLKHSFSSSDLESGTTNESPQRRKARLERHQRIMERAAKALEEKNMRDRLAQKEQAERNRLAESLDADIKRWASGKEGNLRALLSTLQYILGAESGWQPISLTEIITTPAVKKAYRKATLYVHPDKLQQRGATIQQKYICEKVFDLLKAAWNRFNSEER